MVLELDKDSDKYNHFSSKSIKICDKNINIRNYKLVSINEHTIRMLQSVYYNSRWCNWLPGHGDLGNYQQHLCCIPS